MPRTGYAGNRYIPTGSGGAVGTVVVPADMVAGDVLAEAAALAYLYDVTNAVPQYLTTARSHAAASLGQRYGATLPMLSNGTTFDPQLNATQGTLLASAARTTSTTGPTTTNYNARSVWVNVHVTVNPGGAQTLQPHIQFQDPVSGAWIDVASLVTADTLGGGAGDFNLGVGPGILTADLRQTTSQAAKGASVPLPRTWRLQVDHSGAGSWTYSASYSYGL